MMMFQFARKYLLDFNKYCNHILLRFARRDLSTPAALPDTHSSFIQMTSHTLNGEARMST